MPRVIVKESYQKMKLRCGEQAFHVEIFGTGLGCAVEIDELHMSTGTHLGNRKRYTVPGRIKLGNIVGRYNDDMRNMQL